MKGILLVLLVITAVLFVAVESRRGSKPRKARACAKACLNCTDRGICVDCKAGFRLNQETNQCEKDCGKNCVRCDGRKCLECDNGFARITITLRRFNKTICKPCAKQTSIKRKGVDRDDSKCAAANTTEAPCPKKCAACENGICLKCDKGFALFSSAKRDSKFCIPCARAAKAGKFANSDKSQCQEACGKGFKLNPKTKKCEKKRGKKGGNKKPKKQGGKRRPKTPAP